ncbi:MAG: YihY/virulence factor BrkB family protein [Roseivirga sp.]
MQNQRGLFYESWKPPLGAGLGKLCIKRGANYITYHAVFVEFFRRLRTNDILEHAYGMAFNFTLAIFPAIISIFMVIPYIPIVALDHKITTLLQEALPAGIYEALSPTIQDTLYKQRRGLSSLGFISTLYLATNGMMSLIKTFDLFHKVDTQDQRSYLKKRGVATLLTLILALALLCAIVLLTAERHFIGYLISYGLIASKTQINLFVGLKLLTVALILLMAIDCIYYLAPSIKKPWPFFSFGSFIATLLGLLASYGFSYYLKNFANYNRVYGSIGIFIALMTWLLMLSAILLVGFELNVSVDALMPQADKKPLRAKKMKREERSCDHGETIG